MTMQFLKLFMAAILLLQSQAVFGGANLLTSNIVLKQYDKSDIKIEFDANKTYIIQAWASWCISCSETMQKVYNDLDVGENKNIEFITVSIDEDVNSAQGYMKKNFDIFDVLRIKNLLDPSAKHLVEYNIESVPATIIIKPKQAPIVYHGKSEREVIRKDVYGNSH